jgi:transposase
MKLKPTYYELLRENQDLKRRLAKAEQRIVALEAENRELRAENRALMAKVEQLMATIEDLRRRGKRQAAPFGRDGGPKLKPKRPGRKAGSRYGKKGHRLPPAPADIDETYDVPLPAKSPCCGAGVEETGIAQQYQAELPRRPIHRQFDVHVGCCEACGKRIQGRHPLQTSDALGAAAAQLGPIAQAAVVWLNKHAGLSHGKISRCLWHLFGINLTPGGSVQVVLRAGERCEAAYQELIDQARKDPWASLDETGWRIGGLKAWLHVCVTQMVTIYAVDPTRSAAAAFRILGRFYAGLLLHDGWAAYDAFGEAEHQQCIAHIIRRCDEILETADKGGVRLPRAIKELMQRGLRIRTETATLPPAERAARRADAAEALTVELERMVTPAKMNRDNDRLAVFLWDHLDEWFAFLEHDFGDATNWRAEHAIRGPVVNRKVWGGNRTPRGARAQGVLCSMLATCMQHARDSIEFLAETLQGHAPALLPAVA